jgi:hypothetical protein
MEELLLIATLACDSGERQINLADKISPAVPRIFERAALETSAAELKSRVRNRRQTTKRHFEPLRSSVVYRSWPIQHSASATIHVAGAVSA